MSKTIDSRPVSCAACGWNGIESDLIGEGDWIDVYCPSCRFKVRDPNWDAALYRAQGRVTRTHWTTPPASPHLPKQTLLNVAKLARLDAAASTGEVAAALEKLAVAAEAAAGTVKP